MILNTNISISLTYITRIFFCGFFPTLLLRLRFVLYFFFFYGFWSTSSLWLKESKVLEEMWCVTAEFLNGINFKHRTVLHWSWPLYRCRLNSDWHWLPSNCPVAEKQKKCFSFQVPLQIRRQFPDNLSIIFQKGGQHTGAGGLWENAYVYSKCLNGFNIAMSCTWSGRWNAVGATVEISNLLSIILLYRVSITPDISMFPLKRMQTVGNMLETKRDKHQCEGLFS